MHVLHTNLVIHEENQGIHGVELNYTESNTSMKLMFKRVLGIVSFPFENFKYRHKLYNKESEVLELHTSRAC